MSKLTKEQSAEYVKDLMIAYEKMKYPYSIAQVAKKFGVSKQSAHDKLKVILARIEKQNRPEKTN